MAGLPGCAAGAGAASAGGGAAVSVGAGAAEPPGGGAVAGTSCAKTAPDVSSSKAAAITIERIKIPSEDPTLAIVRATKKPEAGLPALPFLGVGEG